MHDKLSARSIVAESRGQSATATARWKPRNGRGMMRQHHAMLTTQAAAVLQGAASSGLGLRVRKAGVFRPGRRRAGSGRSAKPRRGAGARGVRSQCAAAEGRPLCELADLVCAASGRRAQRDASERHLHVAGVPEDDAPGGDQARRRVCCAARLGTPPGVERATTARTAGTALARPMRSRVISAGRAGSC